MNTNPNQWIKAFAVPQALFCEPESGYDATFTPTKLEQRSLREQFELKGEIEAKWVREGNINILLVREV